MRVKHEKNMTTGMWEKEIIYKSHRRLLQLKYEYENLGFRTWLNLWDNVKNEWILTVEMGINYAK